MVFANPAMPLTVPTQISLLSEGSVEGRLVGRIGAVRTGNVDRVSPDWQICLEQASQITGHEIGLAQEIAVEDARQ
jgi:hypothetical protein